jgi:hypothetical protein
MNKPPATLTKQVAYIYYELEALVDANKLRAYTNRIRIAENTNVGMEIANAAFNESRQLLNDACQAIVRNKKVILQHQSTQADCPQELTRGIVDQAELDYLERRSSLNKAVLGINKKLSDINSQLVVMIGEILETNDELLEYNQDSLITGDQCSHQDYVKTLSQSKKVDELSTENLEKHQAVFEKAQGNLDSLEVVYDSATRNKEALSELRVRVDAQKEKIAHMWNHVEAQQEFCFDLIQESE